MPKASQKKDSAQLSAQKSAGMEEYEKGLRLLQNKDYAKAIPRFEAILADSTVEPALCDRARVYLRIAREEVKARLPVRTTRNPAESYEVGVFLLNDGDFKEAARHLERAAEHAPADDSVLVALAAALLHSGDAPAALKALQRAVELNPGNRVRMRNMSDFALLESHPEYQALLGA